MDFLTPCFFLAALFGYATSSDLSFGGNPENLSTLVPSSTEVKLEISTSTTSSPLTANVPMPANIGKGTEECYDELGCFDTNGPWFTITRPFPAPSKPEVIKTGLHLFTRNHNKSHHVKLWPEIKLDGTDYDPKRTTVFITHGFAADSSAQWMHDMKDAYLENSDANVFLTDWGHGARLINYLQAGSNTRVVGAELARFGKHLLEKGQSPDKMHLIGHSLGAHISGYFAKRMKSWNHTVSRVTACDPAQPGFELEDGVVKLKKGDADVVDVIHTDARPFIPFLGFGMLQPIGDVDFYVNGGAQQPGCYSVEVPENITSIADLALIPVETLSKWVSCSHGRSYEYLTWSFKNKDCLFVGRKMTNVENAFKVGTLGTLRLVDPVVDSVRSCTKENCNIMGLFTPNVPARGSFAVSTNSEPPYCKSEEDKQRSLYNVLSLGTYGLAKKALPTLKKINLFSP